LALDYLDIYELLDQVRRRPGMFLGRPGTLPLLSAFLSGLRTPPLRPEGPRFAEFHFWLSARIDELPDSHNMVGSWLEEQLGPEKALDAYFKYLDEYRKNTVELIYVNAGPLRPRFTHGDGTAPRIPGRLVVGRYAPSDIHFWGTQTGPAPETQFHFCHSAAKAKKLAAAFWDTPPRTWLKLTRPERLSSSQSTGFWALLEEVRKRPGMYCDPATKPLTTLETMLWGYTAALDDHRIPDSGRGFNEAFRAYLQVRFGWSTCSGWGLAIRDHLKTGEEELAKFFTVLGEFKSDLGHTPDDLRVVAGRLDALTLGADGVNGGDEVGGSAGSPRPRWGLYVDGRLA
jgi:hypothetical protein